MSWLLPVTSYAPSSTRLASTDLRVPPRPRLGPFTFQDVLDAIHAAPTSDPALSALPKGTPGAGKDVTHPVLLDTTQARTVLGLEFKGLNEVAKDTSRSLLEREKALSW